MFMVTIQLQQMSNSQLRLLSLSTASQLDMELIDNSTELFIQSVLRGGCKDCFGLSQV